MHLRQQHQLQQQQQQNVTYDRVEKSLQIICCLATFGTFFRIIFEQELPHVFLFVPSLLPGLYILRHHTTLSQDTPTLAMLTGAGLGVVSGFLSGIVKETSHPVNFDLKVGHGRQSQGRFEEHNLHQNVKLLYHLEFLHLPVIFGSLMFSYCLVFDRLPSVRATRHALFTGFVSAMLWTAGYVIVMGNASSQTLARVFMFTYIMVFLFVYSTVIREYQRPWITTVIFFCAILYWESGYFDSLIWDFPSSRFPIPGSITGMVIIFIVKIQDSNRCALKLPAPATYSKFDKPEVNYNTEIVEMEEVQFNLLVWQGITYITEQISLAVIQTTKPKQSGEIKDQPGIVFSCLTMSAYIGVMSAFFKVPLLSKVHIVLILLFLYLVLTLSSQVLHNGYFLEMILGFTVGLVTHPEKFK